MNKHTCMLSQSYIRRHTCIQVKFSYISIKTNATNTHKSSNYIALCSIRRPHSKFRFRPSNIFTSPATLHGPDCTKPHQTSQCNICMTVIPRAMILSLSHHYRKFHARYLCWSFTLTSYGDLVRRRVCRISWFCYSSFYILVCLWSTLCFFYLLRVCQ